MNALTKALLSTALALPLLAGAASAKTTINFWTAWTPGAEDAVAAEKAIADFEAANPDIDVVPQVIAYDALHDKLVTAITGGDAPDISWGLSEWFGELNRMGALADLTSKTAAWDGKDAIYPKVIDNLTIDGKLMALPNYLGLRAMLYHSDMLKKAGVEPPKTWDELLAASKKIEAATGKPGFGIAGRGVRSPQELLMYLGQAGVEIAEKGADGKYRNTWAEKPDQMAKAASVFAFYKKMLDEGAIPKQAAGWGWEEEDNNFALGQYAMVVDGSWMNSRTAQNPDSMADVKVAPPAAGTKEATFFEIAPLYVFKNDKVDATWKFASYLLSKDVQEKMFPNRSPRQDVKGDPVWGEAFTALTPIGISFPPIALGSIPTDMEEAIGKVLLAGKSPEEAAAGLAKAVNTSLKRSGQLSGS